MATTVQPDTTTDRNLRAAVELLAEKRRTRIALAGQMAGHEADFAAQHHATLDALAEARRAEAAADLVVRTLAVSLYADNPDAGKHLGCGVTISERTEIVVDVPAVLAFAKRTGIGLLPETYDRKVLDAIAKNSAREDGTTQVDGLTVVRHAEAKIASDLDAALAADGVA